jgi:basic membrane protein A
VEYADENVRALIVYREDGDREKLFVDEEWGYETGADLIQRGADVVFAAGGVTGQGALRAASEYQISAIGAERDQAAALGESGASVVTSFYGDARLEVQEMMRRVREGQGNGGRIGQIQISAPDPSFPPSAIAQLEALIGLLESGEISPNILNEKP